MVLSHGSTRKLAEIPISSPDSVSLYAFGLSRLDSIIITKHLQQFQVSFVYTTLPRDREEKELKREGESKFLSKSGTRLT